MIRRLVLLCVQRKALVLALSAAVLVAGALQVSSMKVDTLPEFTPPYVEVQTEALGLSALEVEQLITAPLEADLLNGVAWLEDIRSQSLPGLSSIVMTFEEGTDLLEARQVVQERLTQAAGLPNVSRAPAMVQPLSSENRVMMVGLTSDDLSLIELSVLARWTVRPFLMGGDGVANVSVWGQRQRQLQVQVDPETLRESDVTLLDVVKTTGNALWTSPLSYLEASTPGTGGFIDGPNQRIGVQHVFSIDGPEDLAGVPIEGNEELTLGDLVTVVEDHQPLIGDAIVEDGDGLLLIVEKFPWSNTTEVTNIVEEALDELAPGLSGVTVTTDLFRPASYVERSTDNVALATGISILVVAALVFLLIGGWRAAIVALASLLVSLSGALLLLMATDTTVNAMVFAGLGLMMIIIIGDTIMNADALRQHLGGGDGDRSLISRTANGVLATQRPLLYATTVMAIAAIPALLMDGAAGEFLPTIALVMLVAVLVAQIVGVTVTPALHATLHPNHNTGATKPTKLSAAMHRVAAISQLAFRKTALGIGAAVVLGALALALVPTIDRDFVPTFKQTDLLIGLEAAAGTSLQETERIVSAAVAELRTVPGVRNVGAQVGRAVLSDEVANVNSSGIWVNIDPDADYDGTVAAVQAVVQGYPGIGLPNTETFANVRVTDILQQPTDDLVVRVYGEDPEILGPLADEVAAMVSGVDGTSSVRAMHPVSEPTVEIEVDLERAAATRIKPGDVRRAAATLLSGIEVGSFFEEQKVFDVIVWSPPEQRNSVTAIRNLLIDTPSGDVVRLEDVADVRIAPNQAVIRRDAVSRYIDVIADVSDRNLDEVGDDVEVAVAAAGLPFEYHVAVQDDRTDADADQQRVAFVILTAAIAAFLVLQAAFDSWRLAFLSVLLVPLSLAGSVVAIAIGGGIYSIGSAIGLFGVAAITLRSLLTLMQRYQSSAPLDFAGDRLAYIDQRSEEHIGAALTNFVAVGAAMIPLILFGDIAGLEILRPMAVAVLGGMFSSAAVLVVIAPSLFLMLSSGDSPSPDEPAPGGHEQNSGIDAEVADEKRPRFPRKSLQEPAAQAATESGMP